MWTSHAISAEVCCSFMNASVVDEIRVLQEGQDVFVGGREYDRVPAGGVCLAERALNGRTRSSRQLVRGASDFFVRKLSQLELLEIQRVVAESEEANYLRGLERVERDLQRGAVEDLFVQNADLPGDRPQVRKVRRVRPLRAGFAEAEPLRQPELSMQVDNRDPLHHLP